MELGPVFTTQAAACEQLGSPMYAALLRGLADDLPDPASGVRLALRGHEDDPGPSALALRLLGSVHRLVLERRAGDLATYYPSVGGVWEDVGGLAAMRRLLAEQHEEVASWLDRPPQTNEVGRAAALWAALRLLADDDVRLLGRPLPVHLVELGSSGGLNLNVDRYAYVGADGHVDGDPASPVRLDPAWSGGEPPPSTPTVASRLGSDLRPVDVTSTDGRLALSAYVWPDQVERFERLRGALAIAAAHPPRVVVAGAGEMVDDLRLVEGATTVVWHSVMWQYLDRVEQERVLTRLAHVGAGATDTRRLAHVRAEPSRRTPDADHEFLVRVRAWPVGEDRLLGTFAPHGVPVGWELGSS